MRQDNPNGLEALAKSNRAMMIEEGKRELAKARKTMDGLVKRYIKTLPKSEQPQARKSLKGFLEWYVVDLEMKAATRKPPLF